MLCYYQYRPNILQNRSKSVEWLNLQNFINLVCLRIFRLKNCKDKRSTVSMERMKRKQYLLSEIWLKSRSNDAKMPDLDMDLHSMASHQTHCWTAYRYSLHRRGLAHILDVLMPDHFHRWQHMHSKSPIGSKQPQQDDLEGEKDQFGCSETWLKKLPMIFEICHDWFFHLYGLALTVQVPTKFPGVVSKTKVRQNNVQQKSRPVKTSEVNLEIWSGSWERGKVFQR